MPLHEGIGLDAFHELTELQATHVLYQCCSSCIWASRVVAARPFASLEAVLDRADALLADLREVELEEALAGHPRIGEATSNASSQREQAGVAGADPEVLAALAAGNARYEERFGRVYLVFADGRPAAELLGVLQSRLDNDPTTELAETREQLRLITRARLRRALEPVDWETLSWQG